MAEVLELSPADLAGDLLLRTHTLLSNAFPEDAPNEGDYYRTHGEPTAVLVLCEAPHVLGHLAPYLRQVRIGDEALEIGMLGGIVVAPEHRGRGCSRALVRHAHNRLRQVALADVSRETIGGLSQAVVPWIDQSRRARE